MARCTSVFVSKEHEDVAFVVFLLLVAARCLGIAPSVESATMLDDGSAPTVSVVTLVVERRRGSPSGTITGSARTVAAATTGAEQYAGSAPTKAGHSPRRSGKGCGYGGVGKSGRSSKDSQPRGDGSTAGEAADGAPGIEQVMHTLRAVNNGLAVAQLLALKQCEAEQTRTALRAIRPLRTQLKAAIESRDNLLKEHSAAVDGVQSLTAQLQARQSESEELATAVDHLLETMPGASVPATPMRGSEQVVFRLHLDANPDGQARDWQFFSGTVVVLRSCSWLARLAGGPKWTPRGVMARIRWLRGRRAVLGYHLRDWALANIALVKQEFEAFVIEKADWAEFAAVKGDSRTLHSIVKELGVRKRCGHKKVVLEDGSVAQDAKQEQRWWLKHFASELGGSTATEDRSKFPEIGSVVSTTCKPPSFDEIADVVAILPKWRATAPHGIPNEALQSAPLVMVSHLVSLLRKVYTGGRVPSAWRGTRLVDVPKTNKAGCRVDQTKRRSVGLETSASKIFSRIVRRTVPQLVDWWSVAGSRRWEAFHGDRRRLGRTS